MARVHWIQASGAETQVGKGPERFALALNGIQGVGSSSLPSSTNHYLSENTLLNSCSYDYLGPLVFLPLVLSADESPSLAS